MPKISLTFIIDHAGWKKIPRLEAKLRRAARGVLEHLPQKMRGAWRVNVLLTDNAALRHLNRTFRGQDKPTNILSFPVWEPKQMTRLSGRITPAELGDIALGYQYIVAEAKNDHKMLINHVNHLLIHGILHLLGYDHLATAEANRMERLEQKIMARLGLPDPYAPVREKKKGSRKTAYTKR